MKKVISGWVFALGLLFSAGANASDYSFDLSEIEKNHIGSEATQSLYLRHMTTTKIQPATAQSSAMKNRRIPHGRQTQGRA